MPVAESIPPEEREALSPEAEARYDFLLSFDPDGYDGWENWPYDHVPGECCPRPEFAAEVGDDEAWDRAWTAHLDYDEPKRRR